MSVPVAVQAAKARAESLMLAQQSLEYWRAIHEGILQSAASAATELLRGENAAIPAKAIRQQGEQALRLAAKIEAKQAAVAAALGAVFSFTEAEVTESIAYLRETCEMMRDTPSDGSELSTLLASIEQRHTAPNLL